MNTTGEENTPNSHLFLAKFFMLSSLILILVAAALGGYLILAPNQTISVGAKTTISQHIRQTTPGQYQSEVTQVGQEYMNALLKQQYTVMWSMLHPDVQKMWPDEQSFASYWQRRFQNFKLRNFSSGQVSDLSSWTNAETMHEYEQVSRLPISLQLDPVIPHPPPPRSRPRPYMPMSFFAIYHSSSSAPPSAQEKAKENNGLSSMEGQRTSKHRFYHRPIQPLKRSLFQS
ncbi:hypothetical protein [Dictyobacter kobayashii]|uniref:hypothetical protein n=1 Tax=Dictyobacter kobayashii TaxID=2014872 RepID=UPI000F848700|nr:hypothetical protein [Dictyobacter kobayashii]